MKPSRWLCVGATLAGVALPAGCVTSGEGETMRKDTAALKLRLDAMDKRYAESNEQMDRLKHVLDEATLLLTRNSADLGARVAKNDQDLAAINGRLEEARHLLEQLQKKATDDAARTETRLTALESNTQKIADRVAPSLPEDKDTLWKESQSRLAAGQRDEARRFFRAFLQRFPQDLRAPEAQLTLGRSYTTEGKHTQAAAEYQKVLETYPKSLEVPEAMWLLGQAFVELKFCADAKAIFVDYGKRFPRAPHVKDAKMSVRELQKASKDPKRCTS